MPLFVFSPSERKQYYSKKHLKGRTKWTIFTEGDNVTLQEGEVTIVTLGKYYDKKSHKERTNSTISHHRA